MNLRNRMSSMTSMIDDMLNNEQLEHFFDWGNDNSRPAVNVVENDHEYRVELAAPGLEKTDFIIELQHDQLTIAANKKDQTTTENKYIRREFKYTVFKRSFTCPKDADTDKIKATHRNGILVVSLPKKQVTVTQGAKNITIE